MTDASAQALPVDSLGVAAGAAVADVVTGGERRRLRLVGKAGKDMGIEL